MQSLPGFITIVIANPARLGQQSNVALSVAGVFKRFSRAPDGRREVGEKQRGIEERERGVDLTPIHARLTTTLTESATSLRAVGGRQVLGCRV